MGRFQTTKNAGGGRGRASNPRKRHEDTNRRECKFHPLGIGKNKAAFDQVKDKVENDTQQTFGKGSRKMVESLRNMKECDWKKDSPTLKASTLEDNDDKQREDRQCELDCTEEKKDHAKKKEQCEADMEKAHAKTWDEHTSETMKSGKNIAQDNPVMHEDCDIADAILNPKSESHTKGWQ